MISNPKFLLVKINVEACDLGNRELATDLHPTAWKVAYLREITRTSQVQDIHVLVDVLAVEPSKNKYPTISQKRHMIPSW